MLGLSRLAGSVAALIAALASYRPMPASWRRQGGIARRPRLSIRGRAPDALPGRHADRRAGKQR